MHDGPGLIADWYRWSVAIIEKKILVSSNAMLSRRAPSDERETAAEVRTGEEVSQSSESVE